MNTPGMKVRSNQEDSMAQRCIGLVSDICEFKARLTAGKGFPGPNSKGSKINIKMTCILSSRFFWINLCKNSLHNNEALLPLCLAQMA